MPSNESSAACPYCGEPKARHEYVSPSSCVLSSTASAAYRRRPWWRRYTIQSYRLWRLAYKFGLTREPW